MKLVTEKEAAEMLGMSRGWLARGRMEGAARNGLDHPPYIKIGTAVRYSVDDLEAWVMANRIHVKTGVDLN